MKFSTNNVLTLPQGQEQPAASMVAIGAEQPRNVVRFRPRERKAQTPLAHSGNALRKANEDTCTLGEIWNAIEQERVVSHYQPQFDFATGRIVAAEALVRAEDEQGDLMFPDRFIELAERSGMIVPLGRAVIRQVCADLASWRRRGASIARVSINVSANQLNVDDLLATFIGKMLDLHGLRHSDLEFELTERQALDLAGPAKQTLQELVDAGARLALDDFGVGFSSLSYLTELDVHTVKLDRSMTQKLPEHAATATVAAHILALAVDLGLTVVGEGIETQAQLNHLQFAGCHLGQGFLLARPMSQEALLEHLL